MFFVDMYHIIPCLYWTCTLLVVQCTYIYLFFEHIPWYSQFFFIFLTLTIVTPGFLDMYYGSTVVLGYIPLQCWGSLTKISNYYLKV